MIERLEIIIPWPPTANKYYRMWQNRMLISSKGRKYKSTVAEVARRAKWKSLGKSRLAIEIILYPPDRRRYDIDNRIKPTLDALEEAGLFDNDEQIDDLHISRGKIGRPPRAHLFINKLERV